MQDAGILFKLVGQNFLYDNNLKTLDQDWVRNKYTVRNSPGLLYNAKTVFHYFDMLDLWIIANGY